MKKYFVCTVLLALSMTALAKEHFYYFAKTVDGKLHYTRILRCDAAAINVSDTLFSATDAVGPINDFQTAQASLHQVLKRARLKGKRVNLSQGKCLAQ